MKKNRRPKPKTVTIWISPGGEITVKVEKRR